LRFFSALDAAKNTGPKILAPAVNWVYKYKVRIRKPRNPEGDMMSKAKALSVLVALLFVIIGMLSLQLGMAFV
jgi:hypothetical protein